ncbi:regulation of nuclear pre-mRNA domain-containing protein 1B-like [Cucurbita moschata]|uniref:Regulation of nuclear pre-mRNA domain-containing protein 1B-like n=1 Tax=Cucurbita moschata TaxID=3662 RepID=A0A6J1E332_CUCMO|nr:regulation of nuclear pre-mRNA domain-containing protein 1B-like [Cucurbita moschata]XP_022922048.1 regulation of nuclear pre-mRNA domain-containing protein 1B-like [Cucurbita moschata]XP_022922056.1 regulation of nuclear pre-mRNA domain-containing protein 1B-like [Cucurbita moschata]
MAGTFNPHILVDKLARLNNSQASIETLSHWCIFHMNKAKQVVETWDKQFHCSPRDQRLAYLYLANDILQNSRRKGSEFVGEFWKVLPDALRDVIENGDDFGRNAALRLIGIWEERKVFGSRGQSLKEEIMGKHTETGNRNGKQVSAKLKQSGSISLDKIVSGYQVVFGSEVDEDVVLSRCSNTISYLEKLDKEIGADVNSGQYHGTSIAEDLRGHHTILRDCIEQLRAIETSRASLVSHLREALQEQEFKLERVRNQLQASQSRSEQTQNLCPQFLNGENVQPVTEGASKDAQSSIAPHGLVPREIEQSTPVMYAASLPFPAKPAPIEEDPRKSAAAAVAAKLTASTSSVQMLSYVLSSLASEGVIGNPNKELSCDYPSEKRTKLENDQSPYVLPPNPQQPPVSSFPHPESLQRNASSTSQPYTPPPPSSSPPPIPPLPPVVQFTQNVGSVSSMPFSYTMTQSLPPLAKPGYPNVGAPVAGMSPFTIPTNSYQSFQGSDANFYNQTSSMPMAPVSRP